MKTDKNNSIEFIISSKDSKDFFNDSIVLGSYDRENNGIRINLSSIARSDYNTLKYKNKEVFEFISKDYHNESEKSKKTDYIRKIDDMLQEHINDQISETILHELTHRFSGASHPEEYEDGRNKIDYLSNSCKNLTYSDKQELAKRTLKDYDGIQTYTTLDFDRKLWDLIKYSKRR